MGSANQTPRIRFRIKICLVTGFHTYNLSISIFAQFCIIRRRALRVNVNPIKSSQRPYLFSIENQIEDESAGN